MAAGAILLALPFMVRASCCGGRTTRWPATRTSGVAGGGGSFGTVRGGEAKEALEAREVRLAEGDSGGGHRAEEGLPGEGLGPRGGDLLKGEEETAHGGAEGRRDARRGAR